jgi:hypothetical protein
MKTESMKAFTTERTERTEIKQRRPLDFCSVLSVGSVVNAFSCPNARIP